MAVSPQSQHSTAEGDCVTTDDDIKKYWYSALIVWQRLHAFCTSKNNLCLGTDWQGIDYSYIYIYACIYIYIYIFIYIDNLSMYIYLHQYTNSYVIKNSLK